MVFSGSQFPMLLSLAVNIYIPVNMYIYKIYQTTVRWYRPCVALLDDGSCLLIQSPASSSTQVLSPPWNKGHISRSRSHLLIKVISIDQGHIYWSRLHLLIKVTSIDQALIYDNRSSSHLFIEVTSIYQGHIYRTRSHLWSRSCLSIQSRIFL